MGWIPPHPFYFGFGISIPPSYLSSLLPNSKDLVPANCLFGAGHVLLLVLYTQQDHVHQPYCRTIVLFLKVARFWGPDFHLFISAQSVAASISSFRESAVAHLAAGAPYFFLHLKGFEYFERVTEKPKL